MLFNLSLGLVSIIYTSEIYLAWLKLLSYDFVNNVTDDVLLIL